VHQCSTACLGSARAENTHALHAPLCREFLQRKYAGLMEVEVKAASGLPAADVSATTALHNALPHNTLPVPSQLAAIAGPGLEETSPTCANTTPAPLLQWFPGSKSDPYAVLNIGYSAGATAVVNQSLDPQWGETFYLFVRWGKWAVMSR
jgi:hypothetical protein